MNITLADCEVEEGTGPHGVGTRWTHESGAYVELIHDDCPHNPLDDVEGIAVAYREGDRYQGTADEYPRYPIIICPTCEGSGVSTDRFVLVKTETTGWSRVVGAGTESAMLALEKLYGMAGQYEYVQIEPDVCPRCNGNAQIETDIETYFKVDREARAIYQFDTGYHGEATAVMYVTDDDWTDPAGAAKAFAEEYQSWAEGDVWGIECGGPGVETESCWSFIGRDHAEESALLEFLIPTITEVNRLRDAAIEAARIEKIERDYWAARDIITEEV